MGLGRKQLLATDGSRLALAGSPSPAGAPAGEPGAGAPARQRRLLGRLAAGLVAALLVAAGVAGAVQYGVTFWLYRGFPPPKPPVSVHRGHHVVSVRPATVVHFVVPAPSLGGWGDPVWVVLPPGYAQHPRLRYPVLYLLHGTPGDPMNFFLAGDLLPTYEVLLAKGRLRPMIIVVPSGARGFFADTEWANGVLPDSGWETFVARTLVGVIDHRFRTIATARGRAIGGLSEGGYAALNIGFHHLNEFSVLESWSGYETAFDIPAIYGRRASLLRLNSPFDELASLAPSLRAHHEFIWMYIGLDDLRLTENEAFSAALAAEGISHRFQTEHGRHSWALWRAMMGPALIAASTHLDHG